MSVAALPFVGQPQYVDTNSALLDRRGAKTEAYAHRRWLGGILVRSLGNSHVGISQGLLRSGSTGIVSTTSFAQDTQFECERDATGCLRAKPSFNCRRRRCHRQ